MICLLLLYPFFADDVCAGDGADRCECAREDSSESGGQAFVREGGLSDAA